MWKFTRSLSNACLFVDRVFQSSEVICVWLIIPNQWFVYDACPTNRPKQRLWIQNFLGQTRTFPSRGQRIDSKFTLAFYGNKMRQTELKTSVSLSPSKQLLCEIYILSTCAGKRKRSQYDWRKKNPHVVLNTVHLLDRDFWFTNTVTLPIYSLRAFTDAKSSLPIYSVRAFSDETSSLPTYSVRALYWQIEIWSGIYTYCTF